MKSAALFVLLVSSLAIGQNLQDVSPKDSPLSLKIAIDPSDGKPAVYARSNSVKGVLALYAVIKYTDESGEVIPWHLSQDYAFKTGPLESHEERPIAPVEGSQPGAKVTQAVGAVLFVQFVDGSIWGDEESGKKLRAARPKKLAFLKALVETYYESGEQAFNAMLNDPKLELPTIEGVVAGCLKAEAGYRKLAPIDLAKKELGDAQRWYALGIF